MRRPRIVDMSNNFKPEELQNLGFPYEAVGRRKLATPTVVGNLPGNNSKISTTDSELMGSLNSAQAPA